MVNDIKNRNTRRCWICGKNPANSGEHSIKNSTLKALFGKGTQKLVKKTGLGKTPIQSTNSKHLKYKVICEECNNNFTSNYDKAYDKLIYYINNNIDSLNKKSCIVLSNVFENSNGIQDCYRYFVKHFGCALYNEGIELPTDIVDCINKKIFPCKLGLKLILHSNCLEHGGNLRSHQQAGVENIEIFENYVNKVFVFGIHIGSLQILMFHNENNNDPELWY